MTTKELLTHVDHTLLKSFATWEDIKILCDDAVKYNTASVCIPPCYVKRVHDNYENLNICTVVGFPLGYETLEGKIADTVQCLKDGASEIDMVINICEVKNGNFDVVRKEITELRKICKNNILKVIIETCYLTEDEKKTMCKIVTEEGADYIKTSTGFGTNGATLEDIILFRNNIGANVKIKAAGGIRSVKTALEYMENGCDRIGASAVIEEVKKEQ